MIKKLKFEGISRMKSVIIEGKPTILPVLKYRREDGTVYEVVDCTTVPYKENRGDTI